MNKNQYSIEITSEQYLCLLEHGDLKLQGVLSTCKDLHRDALNIESAIKGIRLIRLRNKTMFNIMNAFLNEKMHKAVSEQVNHVESITANIDKTTDLGKKLLKKISDSLVQSEEIAGQSLSLGKRGKNLGILGGILGGVGVLFGIVSLTFSIRSCSDGKILNNNIDSIIHKQNSQNKKIDSVLEISKTLFENKPDSIISRTKVSQEQKHKDSPVRRIR